MLRVLGVVRAERPAPNNQSALALVAGQPPAFLWLSISVFPTTADALYRHPGPISKWLVCQGTLLLISHCGFLKTIADARGIRKRWQRPRAGLPSLDPRVDLGTPRPQGEAGLPKRTHRFVVQSS
jgi:hypothetical protein